MNSSYAVGKAEAQVDIVPGLMPPAYVLGLMDAKSKKYPDKNKPGFDWVEDLRKKGGGYYRKSRKSSHAAVVGKVAAGVVLAGAGAAAIAAHHRQNNTKSPNAPVLPIVPSAPPRASVNKKVVAGAGLSAIAAVGAGAAAASRMRIPQPSARQETAPQNTRVTHKQVTDPWSERSATEEHQGVNLSGASDVPTSKTTPPQLPPARYQPRDPTAENPWETPTSVHRSASSQAPTSNALPQLPPAKPVTYKRKLVPKTPKLRQQINLAKREQTGLKKAQEDIELGQHLQTKTHSPADLMRGADVEMNAQEKIANLKARSPERTPAGLATIRGKNRSSVRVGETAEGSRSRKEKEVKKTKLLLEAQDLLPSAEPEKESTTPSDVDNEREAKIKARQREERIENKKNRKELGEITLKTAGRVAISKARKEALNAVVPKLGDAVDTVYRLKGDKVKLERWASELEDAGNTPMSRRKFFRRSKQFVAKETTRKPKTATDELKRGVEVSKDFFDKVFDKGDKIILQGGTERMGSGDKMIQLSKHEFDRITKDYTHADRRALRSFLDLIKFPLP